MIATQNGHEQVALVLLEVGASLKVVSIDNFTILMAASLGGLTTVCSNAFSRNRTLTRPVVATHVTEAGYTALMYAAGAGRQHCVQALLGAGARKV